MPSIYIINPASSAPGYHTAEAFADATGGWTQVADLSVVTLAALVPSGWAVRLVDEAISPADLASDADFVAITGKVSQRTRMIELAAEFRRRGRTVLIGGSFASLNPDDMRPHADVLVTGEIEQLAPKLFADLAAGNWDDRYDGGQADICLSPVPRWDLYPTDRAMAGALQTTRGCPFNCEFCDVIQYQGRKQRHKTIGQVLAELSELHAYGFRNVFLVDDNFTVHRRWARQILEALTEWNHTHADDPVRFLTQASLDVARDADLLDQCRVAGVRTLFMGVETTNEESLRESGKLQNLLLPMNDAISRIVTKGIAVQAGVIVGFDHDGPDIFGTLFEFFQQSPLPDLSIGVLTAPAKTDLYGRLAREGRLIGEVWQTSAGSPFETNIRPARMDRDTLLEGTRQLCTELYLPHFYEKRMLNLIDSYGESDSFPVSNSVRDGGSGRRHVFQMFKRIAARGSREARMVDSILRQASRKPAVLPTVMHFLARYEQARCVLDHFAAPAPSEARVA
ncbi:MAG: Radical domain protein [Bradyrhizobium sp.]|nr:Radical domain protein [Bradyrhizobium sp.]